METLKTFTSDDRCLLQGKKLPENRFERCALLNDAMQVRDWLSELLNLIDLHYEEVKLANGSPPACADACRHPLASQSMVSRLELQISDHLCDGRFARVREIEPYLGWSSGEFRHQIRAHFPSVAGDPSSLAIEYALWESLRSCQLQALTAFCARLEQSDTESGAARTPRSIDGTVPTAPVYTCTVDPAERTATLNGTTVSFKGAPTQFMWLRRFEVCEWDACLEELDPSLKNLRGSKRRERADTLIKALERISARFEEYAQVEISAIRGRYQFRPAGECRD